MSVMWAVVGALTVAVLGLSKRLGEVLVLLGQHEERLRAVERVAENADAAASQLTEDVGYISRAAVMVDPAYMVGGEEGTDDNAAPTE